MSSRSSGYVSFQHFRLTEGVWAHNLLEYKGLCAHFTMTISSSPNNRPKPPSKNLNLDLRIPPEANPRLDSQTKSNASLPKDSASQKDDQIVQTLAKRYPRQILKLVVVAVAPATLLQTCAPATPTVRTNWENCNPKMCQMRNWCPVFIVILPVYWGRLLLLGRCLFSILLLILVDFFSWRLIA
jgi:hypothetical protein